MHRLRVLAFAVALGLGIAGCDRSPKTRLVGVWKESNPLATVLMTFRPDGSFVLTTQVGAKSTDTFGNWSLEGSRLYVRDAISARGGGDGSFQFDLIAISDEALNLRLKNSDSTIYSLARQSSETPPPTTEELDAISPEGRSRLATYRADKAVLNNARQLSASADQYYLENGVSTVNLTDLIGPTAYMKKLTVVAGEQYPTVFTQGVTLTVEGVAGARTITYEP